MSGPFDLALRAEQLGQVGRLAEAEQAAREAVALDPQDPRLLGTLSSTLLLAKRYAEGLAVAEAACAAGPELERSHRLRALHLSLLGRHAEALQAGYVSVSLSPDEPAAAHGYAKVLQRAGRPADAVQVARRVVELDPDSAAAHLLLADCASDLRDKAHRDLARREYEATLRIDPENAAAKHDLALLDARGRRPAKALAGLIAAGRLDPTMPEVARTVVVVLWQLSWRLRMWLFVVTIVTLGASLGSTTGARVSAAVVLVLTAALTWWTTRDLPRRTWPVVRKAVGTDRALTVTYVALALCLLLYVGALASGFGLMVAGVWIILIALGWLALGVRAFRRS
ncbi:tetratricopeptide repeat protein [Pseudonocardia oroxyli]|uniref:Flp pilus assembly protein TadD, contains TPR repeats n=1 Tax=Pseudonocardia oroxyli TaxID=366584 RepID=A0A1G7LA29_PSEOR|nr:tetratricopeptide repeat protein [Pseudonocardia oroxyli]SDF45859.1 Flp pilus assembly protein TadD, contains TPR repeats [Pseudonocardia oroxyli]